MGEGGGGGGCHKIAEFYLRSSLLLLLELKNLLPAIGKPYVKSLASRSDLPHDPPLWVKLES